jgi:hypothetical protein
MVYEWIEHPPGADQFLASLTCLALPPTLFLYVASYKVILTAESLEVKRFGFRIRSVRWIDIRKVQTGIVRFGGKWRSRMSISVDKRSSARPLNIAIKCFSRKDLVFLADCIVQFAPQAAVDKGTRLLREQIVPAVFSNGRQS